MASKFIKLHSISALDVYVNTAFIRSIYAYVDPKTKQATTCIDTSTDFMYKVVETPSEILAKITHQELLNTGLT